MRHRLASLLTVLGPIAAGLGLAALLRALDHDAEREAEEELRAMLRDFALGR